MTDTPASDAATTDLRYRLRVSRVVRETHDSVSVHFTPAPNQRAAFTYRPGQFLTLRLPTPDGGTVSRCYSLASAPGLDDELVVTVKRVEGGPGSNWLCDLADRAEGADTPVEIESLAPTGAFVPKDLDADLLLVAGGSGVTPIMSILRSALHHGTGAITVLYANRDERSVIFARELSELAHEHPERLVVHHWIETVQGLPTVQTVRALTARAPFTEAFVCGPTPFMHCVRDALREAGHDRRSIHLERFNSLAGDPFDAVAEAPAPDHENPAAAPATADAPEPVDSPAEPTPETRETPATPAEEVSTADTAAAAAAGTDGSATGDTGDATVVVDFEGEEHTFPWPAGTVLLDVLKSNGIKAPSSCAEGVCAACECQKTEGEVEMLNNQVLEDEDIADGYILACQSVPRSPVVRIRYEEL